MSKLGITREVLELFVHKRKIYLLPLVIMLIGLIGVTIAAETGLVAFIYPI